MSVQRILKGLQQQQLLKVLQQQELCILVVFICQMYLAAALSHDA